MNNEQEVLLVFPCEVGHRFEMSDHSHIPMYQVDAFVDPSAPGGGTFTGNPAAVCLVGAAHLPLDDRTMQSIAAENNLAETAFVLNIDDSGTFSGSETFFLRWYTPTTEVPLCGHATLAAAAVLFNGAAS